MVIPSTACFLQMKLGASNAFAMDLVAACSGFIYGLSVADAYIRSGRAKKVLVVGSELLNPLIDYTDRTTCILFGDGAGAAVVAECPEGDGILSSHMQSDGNLWELIQIPGPGTVNPLTPDLTPRSCIACGCWGTRRSSTP
jgi:3-oxoacyl-[acyl-carrier-protein] synthase-3